MALITKSHKNNKISKDRRGFKIRREEVIHRAHEQQLTNSRRTDKRTSSSANNFTQQGGRKKTEVVPLQFHVQLETALSACVMLPNDSSCA